MPGEALALGCRSSPVICMTEAMTSVHPSRLTISNRMRIDCRHGGDGRQAGGGEEARVARSGRTWRKSSKAQALSSSEGLAHTCGKGKPAPTPSMGVARYSPMQSARPLASGLLQLKSLPRKRTTPQTA